MVHVSEGQYEKFRHGTVNLRLLEESVKIRPIIPTYWDWMGMGYSGHMWCKRCGDTFAIGETGLEKYIAHIKEQHTKDIGATGR